MAAGALPEGAPDAALAPGPFAGVLVVADFVAGPAAGAACVDVDFVDGIGGGVAADGGVDGGAGGVAFELLPPPAGLPAPPPAGVEPLGGAPAAAGAEVETVLAAAFGSGVAGAGLAAGVLGAPLDANCVAGAGVVEFAVAVEDPPSLKRPAS